MKFIEILNSDKYTKIIITSSVLFISVGHYLLSPHHELLHNILQRLYYLPVIWAAYKYGRLGGLLVSIVSGIVYLPHIVISWEMHPEYQINQIIEILLFIIIGFSSGLLFEQKVNNQRLLQSYEKMALFGNLSRSIIRSLKNPIKAINGMIISLEPFKKNNSSLAPSLEIIESEIKSIEKVRNDLISLVERKKLRLKKQNINNILFDFLSEADLSIKHKNLEIIKDVSNLKLQGYVNKNALKGSFHHLFGSLIVNLDTKQQLKFYSKDTGSYILVGATKSTIKLDKYYYSKLSDLNSDNYHNYDMINVINVMNNHFGDCRFRWEDNGLDEFILAFPKKIKLPWYLKDESYNHTSDNKEKMVINSFTNSC